MEMTKQIQYSKSVDNFKISCSQIGKLMTGEIGLTEKQEQKLIEYNQRELGIYQGNPKLTLTDKMKEARKELLDLKNNPKLPKTVQSYLEDKMKEWLYGQRKDFTSKQTDKGNMMEDSAIEFIIEHLGLDWMTIKNEKFFECDYIKGTPDVILDDEVIDIKCSWDCFTFPLFNDKLNTDYWWQGQGYMHLTGRKKYRVVYCLMDMPEDIIWQLVNKEKWKLSNVDKSQDELYDEIKSKYTYSHLPIDLRLKEYRFDYEKKKIDDVIERVRIGRKYLNHLKGKNPIYKILEVAENTENLVFH